MVLSIILLFAGILSTGYFLAYMFLVGLNNVFTYFWLLSGIAGMAAGIILLVMRRRQIVMPKWISRGAAVSIGLFLLIFLVVEGIIIGYGESKPEQGADYVIVLGARVRGERVTSNLSRRLYAAYDYLVENPQTKVVLSGGQGPGEDITEAEAMRRFLEQKGIASDRMILEDQSVNTDQNLSYSREKIGDDSASIVIVSNRFHIFRALRIAKKKGLQNVQGLGSSTKWYTVPNMYVREGFAVIKYAICGQI